jgi:4-amino-4-deoxy-L-arabinose transferase-like glycosyltransferase
LAPVRQDNLRLSYALRVAATCIAASFVLKLPSLGFIHREPDEAVYWSLAKSLLAGGDYSLRGSAVLQYLSPAMYDRPLFHHPPLFPVLLIPFAALDAMSAAVVLSWAGHALCVLSVALIGFVLLNRAGGELSRLRDLLWILVAGVALDPLLTFVSRKLWIDDLLAGLVSLSIALVYLAVHRSGDRWLLFWGGVVLGLACLAKLPAILAAPLGLILIAGMRLPLRRKIESLLAFAVPAALLILPWLLVFVGTYGTLLPTWLRHDAWTVEHFPLMAEAVARPWYYYPAKLCLALPIVLFLLPLCVVAFRRDLLPERGVPALWFLTFLIVPTLQGMAGYGFQMRYLTPALPALYAGLFAHPLLHGRARRWALPLLLAGILYATLGGAVYLLEGSADEFLTLLEGFELIRFGAP